jgi:hypothetical protein
MKYKATCIESLTRESVYTWTTANSPEEAMKELRKEWYITGLRPLVVEEDPD